MRITLDLVNALLELPSMRLRHTDILKAQPDSLRSFSLSFVEWLPVSEQVSVNGTNPPSSTRYYSRESVNNRSSKELDMLRHQVLDLIERLTLSDEGARHFIELCLIVLKSSSSSSVASNSVTCSFCNFQILP